MPTHTPPFALVRTAYATRARGRSARASTALATRRERAEKLMELDAAVVEVGAPGAEQVDPVTAEDALEQMFEMEKRLAFDIYAELGIELIDVRVKRIDLPPEVSDSVYNRMRQDFVRQATKLRAEGSETSERLKSEADRERTEILAAAYRDAEVLRGEGDSRATGIYASAYSKNAEFYAFYRSLEAYRNSIGGEGDVLVISPDSEFFRYLERAGSKR